MRYLASFFLIISALIVGAFFLDHTVTLAQTSSAGRIVYTYGGSGNGTTEIFLINPDGSGQTRLTDNGLDDRFPAWSPNGSQIALRVTGRAAPSISSA
jgi:hypothetical protein